MITTAPNRLTPNNLKYKWQKVKVRKNGDKNPPLLAFEKIDALNQSIELRALGF
ncbi:hypothetical protein HpDR147_03380 [Helicobacter pylori]